MKRLYRSRSNVIIGGVCAGIAEYFGVDPTVVRLAWAALIFLAGTGVVAYLIAWLVIPNEPEFDSGHPVYSDRHAQPAVMPRQGASPTDSAPRPGVPIDAQGEDGEAAASLEGESPRSPVFTYAGQAAASPEPRGLGGSTVLGLILIGAGGLLLARNILPRLNLERWWPLILVGLGIFVLVTSLDSRRK